MANPTIRVHDLATDEVIDREMTNAEFNEFKAAQIAAEKEEADKAAAKQALLDKLGITPEEAKLLLS
jgi:hypothetical protein